MKLPRHYRSRSFSASRDCRFFSVGSKGSQATTKAIIGATTVLGLIVVLLWTEHNPALNPQFTAHFKPAKKHAAHFFKRFSDYNEDSNTKQSQKVKTEQRLLKKIHKESDSKRLTYLFLKNGSSYQQVPPINQNQAQKFINKSKINNYQLLSPTIDEVRVQNIYPLPSTEKPKIANESIIYVITPTYRRPEQVPELTRLSQTLMLMKGIHWLVSEDASTPTKSVLDFLESCPLPHTYLLAQSLWKHKGKKKARGVSNRNAALTWIQNNVQEGIFYFADDDNTYDYKIFNQIRQTKKVSMFPVGLVTELGVSSPIVKDGKIVGFYDGWIAGRRFPVDMAGFAVNIQFYLQRGAPFMPYNAGFEEDGFLRALGIKPMDVMPLADNCTKILVWHTRTVKNQGALTMPDNFQVKKSNLEFLKKHIVFQNPVKAIL